MNNDVVIVGGGPNGLMLACELSLGGVRPVVLERLPEPSADSRANGLVGQVVRILDRRGLHERITGDPRPPVPAPAYMFAAMRLDLTPLGEDNPLYTLPVPQVRLTELLAQRAAELGVLVKYGHEVTGFVQDEEAVTVEVAGPDGPYRISARYVVGADGGRSVIRKRSGIDFPGVTADDTVSRTVNAIPPAEWIDPATGALDVPGYGRIPALMIHRSETGLFAYAPLPGRPPVVNTLEFSSDEAASQGSTTSMSMAEMRQSIRRVLGVDVPLSPPEGEGPYLTRRLVGTNTRLAERYRDRRVLLLGDAAHVHSASGGPGLNLGIQDAVNLGWKLAAAVREPARAALLDSYEAERRPVGERVIMQTQAQSALYAPGADVTALRELFGELLADPRNVRHIAATMAGSDVRYEPGDHPLVGRLAPDMELDTADGPVRLARLTRTARPLLLDMTEEGLPADGRWDLVRAAAHPDRATALLLRPDTYVAWASSSACPDAGELDALRTAADRWLGRSAH